MPPPAAVDKLGLEYSIYDVLIGECSLVDAMQFSEHGGYQLLPANRDLTAAEVALLNLPAKESACAKRWPRYARTTTTFSSTVRRRCRC